MVREFYMSELLSSIFHARSLASGLISREGIWCHPALITVSWSHKALGSFGYISFEPGPVDFEDLDAWSGKDRDHRKGF